MNLNDDNAIISTLRIDFNPSTNVFLIILVVLLKLNRMQYYNRCMESEN